MFPQEAVTLTAVRYDPQSGVLDVTGQDFSSVDEVLVNDLPVSGFVVVSKTRLLTALPSSVSPNNVTSVAVLSSRLAVTPRSLLRFRVGRTPSKVTGILKLVQSFLKILFSTPGRDVFTQKLGGAALAGIGETFGVDQGSHIVSDFVLAVDTTRRQLISIQGRDTSLPKDEKLMSAKVLSSSFDYNSSSLIVSVEIISQAGRAATANLVV